MAKHIMERQHPFYGVAELGIAQIGAGNEVTFGIRPGTLLLSVGLQTVTAFDSGTTATASVSDGTTTFVNAVDVKTTGAETSANAPKYYPTGGTLTVSLAETGTAGTAGKAFVYFAYVLPGNGNAGIEE